ncbi:hypothetical protein [Amycolatopsis nalaikhensis]|uniref:Uncharacterized protein n=1 Tax=Amycolatopsis nalaikhensis TaxID=715472 RepID=A0ABY8XXL4_9PSEU|nr:hypothetical protein [Amycolatopsis sp. 2-2]WIV60459.1 hypothetical protein QP939_18545 [Amycolatopsis sp. 2-2]
MRAEARARAVDKIASLAGTPTDLVTFWRSCTEVIATVVPHYWAPCYFTVDPASLLITSHSTRVSTSCPPRSSRRSTTARTSTSS